MTIGPEPISRIRRISSRRGIRRRGATRGVPLPQAGVSATTPELGRETRKQLDSAWAARLERAAPRALAAELERDAQPVLAEHAREALAPLDEHDRIRADALG